jgi:hypothetical protein
MFAVITVYCSRRIMRNLMYAQNVRNQDGELIELVMRRRRRRRFLGRF